MMFFVCFNSIKVRLNRARAAHVADVLGCFNSIKVRLNHKLLHLREARLQFQFHKGTIKPDRRCRPEHPGQLFQFHKGTIKPCTKEDSKSSRHCFNSIKVRLNPSPLLLRPCRQAFQFHKGTIKPH